MSVPDDTVTPAPDEVPDPVEATAPQAEPAPDDAPDDALPEGTEAEERGPILPIPGNRASTGFA